LRNGATEAGRRRVVRHGHLPEREIMRKALQAEIPKVSGKHCIDSGGSAQDLSRRSSVSLRTIRRAEIAERHTILTAICDLRLFAQITTIGWVMSSGNSFVEKIVSVHRRSPVKRPKASSA
jgi:hypothetical protein